MTNFPDRDMRRPGYDDRSFPGNPPTLVVGIVVAVVIVGGLIYSRGGPKGDRPQPNQGAAHQITEPTAPTTSPAAPAPAPKL